MRLTILGCGSATPTARHQPSSQVINHRDRLFMIDCGEGAQLRFRRMGLKFSRLNHVFISHLHGDHLFGLPGLLSTMDLHDCGQNVTVHIHPDGIKLLRDWMGYFMKNPQLTIDYDPLVPGESRTVYEDKSLIIDTFPLNHRVPCNGFVFREKPKLRHISSEMVKFHRVPVSQMAAIKEGADFVTEDGRIISNEILTTPADPSASYAYCSDTAPSPKIIPHVAGVDLLYHEATYDASLAPQARERGHSTAGQAASQALEAGVKRLMLGHYSKRYLTEQGLLEEARAIFPNTILADEGEMVDIC